MTKLHNMTGRIDIDDYMHSSLSSSSQLSSPPPSSSSISSPSSSSSSSSLSSPLYYYDLPELDGLDNIHSPDGPLLHALQLASNLYNSYRTWFLINGSSSGIMITIFSFIYIHKMKRKMMNYTSNNNKDKNDSNNVDDNNNNKSIFLICRDAHKSVFDSLYLSHDCDAILIPTTYDDNFKVPLSITIDNLKDVIDNYINSNDYHINDICGLIITRPTYQGKCNWRCLYDILLC